MQALFCPQRPYSKYTEALYGALSQQELLNPIKPVYDRYRPNGQLN